MGGALCLDTSAAPQSPARSCRCVEAAQHPREPTQKRKTRATARVLDFRYWDSSYFKSIRNSTAGERRWLDRHFSRIGFIRKSAYAFPSPSRRETFAFQPRAESRETSTSFRGVPSGFDAS
jgi:hypothetical protein